jgi:hypothetical protein
LRRSFHNPGGSIRSTEAKYELLLAPAVSVGEKTQLDFAAAAQERDTMP